MDVSSHTSWLSSETIQPYYYLNSPHVSGVIRNLNLHFGLFPTRHTTLSSYVWNYHLKQYFSELNSHRYTSLCPINLLDRRSLLPTSSHQYTWCIGKAKNSACESLLYPSCSLLYLLFIIEQEPPAHYSTSTSLGSMIGHALTCFADNQLSRRSISFSLLKSIPHRLM